MKNEPTYSRLSVGSGKNQMYLNIDEETGEVWVDIKYLPVDCYYCALFDGTPVMRDTIGKGKKVEERTFLKLEWLIKDWGGPKNVVDMLKKQRKDFKKNWKKLIEEGNEDK